MVAVSLIVHMVRIVRILLDNISGIIAGFVRKYPYGKRVLDNLQMIVLGEKFQNNR